jgi:hypothetical protein
VVPNEFATSHGSEIGESHCEGNPAVVGKTRGDPDEVLLGYANIDEPLWQLDAKAFHASGDGQVCREANDPVVLFGRGQQSDPKCASRPKPG